MDNKWNEFLDSLDISENEKSIIKSKSTKQKVKAKETLLKEGETCSFIAFVLTGFVKVYTKDNNDNFSVQYLAKSGDFVTSISSFLSQEPTDKFIVSSTNCELIKIEKQGYDELVEELPNLGWKVLDAAIDQLISTLREKNTLISLKAKQRYNYFVKVKGDFIQNIPMGDISSYLGIKQQSLSRIRRDFSG